MTIWETQFDGINHYAVLVFADNKDRLQEVYRMDGKEKHWPVPPKIEPFIEKRKKTPKPRADISYLMHGTLILNQRAEHVLGDFLRQFGQLLAIDCAGDAAWFYNVTNLIDCIDVEKSGKEGKMIQIPVFMPDSIPAAAQVFKEPHTAKTKILLNDAGKAQLESLTQGAGLSGLSFVAWQ